MTAPPLDRVGLEQVVHEYLDLLGRMKDDAARKTYLTAQIVANLRPGGPPLEVVPGVGVRVLEPSRKLDPAAVVAVLSPAQLASVSTVSTALVKALFPVIYEAARTRAGGPTVREL